jgi:hypothetical protein
LRFHNGAAGFDAREPWKILRKGAGEQRCRGEKEKRGGIWMLDAGFWMLNGERLLSDDGF